MTIDYTAHSAFRSAQRGLTSEGIEYVHIFASRFHKGGALFCYLRLQDLPLEDRNRDFAMSLVGTALVLTPDGKTLLTAWRNRRTGLKLIRKKSAYHFVAIEDIE